MIKNRHVVVALFIVLLFAGSWTTTVAKDRSGPSHLFQIVLLVGDHDGETELKDVPPNVLPAVDDVRQFLTYKHYRFVDSAVMRSNGKAEVSMTGPENQQIDVKFAFHLAQVDEAGKRKIQVRSFEVGAIDAPPNDQGWHGVLETSFGVDAGETIVVGSSKLNGSDRALIVLFTAVR